MQKIIQSDKKEEEKILRKMAEAVPVEDITGPKIQKIIKNMKEAMHAEPDAVAIAAPQIGEPLQIFVVAGWVLDAVKNRRDSIESVEIEKRNVTYPDLVCINPKISKLSKKTQFMEEGCLSVRFVYGKVKRANRATITAYDENGKKFERGGSGILAQIFQHETDHLKGVIFTDKATEMETVPPSYVYGKAWKDIENK